ncbi:HypC/HybG/HupF family hydrogenase formation chaperone [Azospirillum halopraeferens]|uniref:HypC/HybG/HupF family hydrogenase formation chaperone n=1 Tax=Azospirillum halopraeferens TaxID=34010 RepID=UPI0003F71EC1|nr:HypC/HybG/HupF family hydrogenase formation chaperone [Azospirillum halopraeferens]
MCIGIPLRLTAVDGVVGRCEDGSAIDLSLLPEARPGDWVLGFLGTARRALDAAEAHLIREALDAVAAAMRGEPCHLTGPAAGGPTLPPHLEAARAAGRTEA